MSASKLKFFLCLFTLALISSGCQKQASFTFKLGSEKPMAQPVSFAALRMMNRNQLDSTLVSIFGPTASDHVYETVFRRSSVFSGPCDLHAAERTEDPGIGILVDKRDQCFDGLSETRYTVDGSSSAVASGWLGQACEGLVQDRTAVTFALRQIILAPAPIPPPSQGMVDALWQLFYPGRNPSPQVNASLLNVATVVGQQPTLNTVADQYAMILLSICLTGAWAVY